MVVSDDLVRYNERTSSNTITGEREINLFSSRVKLFEIH
jgi:hypothetical protein